MISEFKGDGYLVFFGVLEIYAREFKTDDDWILRTSINYLKTKLQIYHANRLTIILQSIGNLSSWSVNISNKKVEIYIPKFRKYLDETTLKKLRNAERKSGYVPEEHLKSSTTEVEADVEVEVDNKKQQRLSLKEEISFGSPKLLDEKIATVSKELYEGKIFPKVHAFVNSMKKVNQNNRAVLQTLTQCMLHRPENPWAYCQKIISVENGNFNEQDYRSTIPESKR